MADLKLGSQIGGNLIWHQGILELNPEDIKLYYKGQEIITNIGGQSILGNLSLTSLNASSSVNAIGNDTSWGTNPNGAFRTNINNTSGAHWLLTSNKINGTLRTGIQVLTNDTGTTRLYTNLGSHYAEFINGQISTSASLPVGASNLTRKDYVDSEINRSLDYTDTNIGTVNSTITNLDNRITNLDTQNVKLTGNQSIAGVKTFTSLPLIPTSTPTTANQVTSKSYVDSLHTLTVKSVSVNLPLTTTGGTTPTLGINNVTTTTDGTMLATDKVKLNGIPSDALSRSGGTMTGTLNISNALSGITTTYNSVEYSLFRHHNNGNVTISAASGDLYLGYDVSGTPSYTTNNVILHKLLKWNNNNGRILIDVDGYIPWGSIKSTPTTLAEYGITDAPTKTGSGASGSWSINAATATTLQTARTLTIGSTGKTFNGSANVSWSLAEIGAAATSHTHNYLPLTGGVITGSLTAKIGANSGFVISANSAGYSELVYVPSSGSSEWSTGLRCYGGADWRVGTQPIWHNGNAPVTATRWPTLTELSIPSNYTPSTATPLLTSDLNSITTAGFYYQSANANATSARNYPELRAGSLLVQIAAGVTQIYTVYGGFGAKTYTRGFYNSVWSAWKRLYDTLTPPTATEVGAVNKTGDEMSGQLAFTTANAASSNQAHIWHNSNGTSGVDAITRSMREAWGATWVWEKIAGGVIKYSTGTTGGGTNTISLGVHNGHIWATQFNGALSGNATTATALQTARTINGVSFNGSANITITAAANGGTSAACSGNSATATLASTVTVNSSASNAFYDMLWRSSNTVYVANSQKAQLNPATGDMRLGGHVSFAYTSDENLKVDICEISNPLAKVCSLRTATYLKRSILPDEDDNHTYTPETGFIAQDLDKVIPNLISVNDYGYKTINGGGFEIEALLAGAIKELKQQHDAEIAELKAQVTALMKRV